MSQQEVEPIASKGLIGLGRDGGWQTTSGEVTPVYFSYM